MHRIFRLIVAIAFSAAITVAAGYATAYAADIQVDAGIGESGCDLIDAIESANSDSAVGGCTAGNSDDVIHLNGIDQLLSTAYDSDLEGPTALPVIGTAIIIEGDSAVISRTVGITESFRILAVSSSGYLAIHDATIGGGRDYGSTSISGLGVYNAGILHVYDSSIMHNIGSKGGGIYALDADTLIVRTDISENRASAVGGLLNVGGTLTISESQVIGNYAGESGGAVGNSDDGIMSLSRTTVAENSAGYRGGGIVNEGVAHVSDTTIADNGACYGGGVSNIGVLTLDNSTITNNWVKTCGCCQGNEGGGILSESSSYLGTTAVVTVTHSTITQNDGNGEVSGIWKQSGSLAIGGSIVAGRNEPYESTIAGDFYSLGHNLVDHAEAATGLINGVNNDQVGTSASPIDAKLGPLTDNGAPTPTHALLPGSPALDAGTCTLAGQPPTSLDQRGFPRPIDLPAIANVSDGCDIGAFESQLASLAISKSAIPDPVAPGGTLTYTLSITNAGPGVASDVAVTDTLPLSITYGGVVTASVGISQANPSMPIWDIQSMPPAEHSIVFTATVDSAASGFITNTAVMTTTTQLVEDADLEATIATEVIRRDSVYLPAVTR